MKFKALKIISTKGMTHPLSDGIFLRWAEMKFARVATLAKNINIAVEKFPKFI